MSTATESAPAEPSDADILAAATAADAGQDLPEFARSPAPEHPSPSAASDESAPTDEQKQQGDEKARAEAEAKAKAEADKEAAAKAATKKSDEAKAETPFKKAQAEAERRDKSWKKLDEEKAAHREAVAKFEQERAQAAGLRTEIETLKKQLATATPRGPVKDEHGLDAAAYDRAAEKYAKDGDEHMARIATARAAALRKQEQAAPAAAAPSAPVEEAWKTPEFQKQWSAEAAAIVQAEPALANPEHPVFKGVNALVNDPKWGGLFRSRPDGIRAAVEVAKLQQAAGRAAALEKELETQKAEVARLNKLTAPRGGHPAAPAPGQKSLADMDEAEADAFVRAAAASADREG